MRDRLDDTLEAEHEAALSAAQRRRTLRDVLLECSDRGRRVSVSAVDATTYAGVVASVGADHVTLSDGDRIAVITIAHIVAVEGTSWR